MEGYIIQLQKLWQNKTTRMVVFMVAMAFAVMGNFTLTSGNGSSSLLSIFRIPLLGKGNFSSHSSYSRNTTEFPLVGTKPNTGNGTEEFDAGSDDDIGLGEDGNPDDGFIVDLGNGTVLKKNKDGYITVEKGEGGVNDTLIDKAGQPPNVFGFSSKNASNSSFQSGEPNISVNSSMSPLASPPAASPSDRHSRETDPKESGSPVSNSTVTSIPLPKRAKEKVVGGMSLSDMNQQLLKNRASPRSTAPLWPSDVDRQMLDAKAQIENAPIVINDQELYPPLFRNFSMFKRSYELMEQVLKVYVYKEGDRPIFHKPFFTGIYASEGWFMKQMEDNTQFVTNDPNKAHLFYMPFSSRILQAVLYVANSHSHKNLIEYLKNYVSTISTKYPFWNRTGGADHFLAACHDWATHETERSMESSIRALCNADVREGFELGKDISLPETYVAYERDPLRNLGGKPAHKRTTLAFFAGQMHGYLRPILVQYWENKDPDMKISGPIPHRLKIPTTNKKNKKKTKTKTTYPYLDLMKDSKYCICPKGYEVNSPRVVEAIFYECVPVIISDNFVPPLFEVLNWEAFSVVVAEKDVPRLKEILVSIPKRKYMALQMGVRRVQRHFLWNKSPVKYDLFHMILHSVWFNRPYQIQVQ